MCARALLCGYILCQDTRIKTKVCVYMCGCVCDYCEYLLQSHRHILISLHEYIPEKVILQILLLGITFWNWGQMSYSSLDAVGFVAWTFFGFCPNTVTVSESVGRPVHIYIYIYIYCNCIVILVHACVLVDYLFIDSTYKMRCVFSLRDF